MSLETDYISGNCKIVLNRKIKKLQELGCNL